MSSYNQSQLDQLNTTVSTTAILGLIGSLAVVLMFFLGPKKSKSNYSRQCIMMVCAMELLPNIGRLLGPESFRDKSSCNVQGAFVLTEVSEAIWNIAHTTNILLRVVYKWKEVEANKFRIPFFILSLILPIFGVSFALGRDSISNSSGAWCNTTDLGVLFGAKHAWIILSMVYSFVITIWVIIFIIRERMELHYQRSELKVKIGAQQAGLKQLLYVVAFFISIPYSTIKRLINLSQKTPFEATLVQALVVPMQGFWCMWIYAYLEGHLSRGVEKVQNKMLRKDSGNDKRLALGTGALITPAWYDTEQYV